MRPNVKLEELVRARTLALHEAQIEILDRLAFAAEYRDDRTGEHTRRVGRSAALIAIEMGLDVGTIELIHRTAPLHDVGKIAIPDAILLKPGRLTEEEFAVMKTHTTIGARILSGGRNRLLRCAEEIALTHHERWDGSGYMGLLQTDIPVTGRIVAIADVFDALTHVRPYKEAWPKDRGVAEIEAQRGRQFDPEVADAFLHVLRPS